MERHLVVYNPPPDLLEAMDDSQVISSWEVGMQEEFLYNTDIGDDFVRDLEEKLWTEEYQDTYVGYYSEDKICDRIGDIDLTKYMSIKTIVPEIEEDVARVVQAHSPPGDIRKYLELQGLGPIQIRCDLSRSRKVRITGMEPLRFKHIDELLSIGVIDEGDEEDPWYPTNKRLFEWRNRVYTEWDLECAVTCYIKVDNNGDLGFHPDGFVIYDADEEVFEWCKGRWKTNPEYPYMQPNELDHYYNEEWIGRDAIRMWWD